jgi:FkbM family methyltransferase
VIQTVKDKLVDLGPENTIVQSVLKLRARLKGLTLTFGDSSITLSRKDEKLILQKRHLVYVPLFIDGYDETFQHFEPIFVDGINTLDFSVPMLRTYRGTGLSLYCASLPEEDSMEMYTRFHKPSAGEVVWDVGANAGATTYHFSKAVGIGGRVIAWEPDPFNFSYLLKNISLHSLGNVTAVSKALSGTTGTALFDMDGSTGGGLSEHLVYSQKANRSAVETLSFQDACAQYGVPGFVKFDIEGGEVDVIRGALPFLETNRNTDFCIETHRMRDQSTTEIPVKSLLNSIGYSVICFEDAYGQHFLSATGREKTDSGL